MLIKIQGEAPTRWCPRSDVCWFIIPWKLVRYISHKSEIVLVVRVMFTNLAILGAPHCSWLLTWIATVDSGDIASIRGGFKPPFHWQVSPCNVSQATINHPPVDGWYHNCYPFMAKLGTYVYEHVLTIAFLPLLQYFSGWHHHLRFFCSPTLGQAPHVPQVVADGKVHLFLLESLKNWNCDDCDPKGNLQKR